MNNKILKYYVFWLHQFFISVSCTNALLFAFYILSRHLELKGCAHGKHSAPTPTPLKSRGGTLAGASAIIISMHLHIE